MPAPFDNAILVLIRSGFLDVPAIVDPDELIPNWRLAKYTFTTHQDAKDQIGMHFKVKEWIINTPSTVEWGHAVIYAGYDTPEHPYPFGEQVTIILTNIPMIYNP